MTFKISIKNIEKEFEKILQKRNESVSLQSLKTVSKLKEELVNNTPVDTGLAKSSWIIVKENQNHNIENNVDYIQYLNQGSSKQAPAYFIESIALKYGVPAGSIVQIKDN